MLNRFMFSFYYFVIVCFLSSFVPLSFMFLNQDHCNIYYFLSVFQLLELFNFLMIGLSGWVGSLMILISFKYIVSGSDSLLLSSRGFSWFLGCVFSVVIFCVLFFCTNNLVVFYVSFEVSVFPTLMLIMKWGYQPERLQASYYFIMYTVCGSLPLLIFLLNYVFLSQSFFLSNLGFSFLFLEIFYPLVLVAGMLAFLVKSPMWGVHLWLPKAHVEAPVSGSMVLAGVLLKLGGYGLIKIVLLTVFLQGFWFYLFLGIGLWGLMVVSFVCVRQIDVKSMIAYSSVIHMSMMLVGVLSGSVLGFLGAMMMMVIHGLCSPGLFAAANYNYECTHSRNLLLQKGFHLVQPVIALVWFMLVSCNMAAPPFLSLGAELFIVSSVLKLGFWLSILLMVVTLFSFIYNVYLFSCQQGECSVVSGFGFNLRSYSLVVFMLHLIPCVLSIFFIYLFVI